jgi:drug/metabolite transporter (DMT)-like permease
VPLAALILMTAVWGVTFVQVKDALELYPLFAFLAVRFAIAAATLAVPAATRVRSLGRRGVVAGAVLGALLAGGYALQTAGLERTTVSSTGFITGMYVLFTPLLALGLFRLRAGAAVWAGVALAVGGLALLSGVDVGSPVGDALVLAGAAVYSLQIVLLERFAPRYDAVAFTLVEMAAALVCFAVIAVAAGQLEVPRGWTVWGALVVTGVFASALGFLVQTWAQRRISATRTALAFAMEPVFTGIFGYALAGDRLGAVGWSGCVLILAGIIVAEPAAGAALVQLVRTASARPAGRPRRRARSARRGGDP